MPSLGTMQRLIGVNERLPEKGYIIHLLETDESGGLQHI